MFEPDDDRGCRDKHPKDLDHRRGQIEAGRETDENQAGGDKVDSEVTRVFTVQPLEREQGVVYDIKTEAQYSGDLECVEFDVLQMM